MVGWVVNGIRAGLALTLPNYPGSHNGPDILLYPVRASGPAMPPEAALHFNEVTVHPPRWMFPCMQVVLLFLVVRGAGTFLLRKKSNGRLYTMLEQCAVVMVGAPVVSTLHYRCVGVGVNPFSRNFELEIPDLLSKFSVYNGHMLQAEIAPPPY